MWRDYPLCDVAEIRMGQSPPSDSYNEDEKGLPFLQGCAEFGRYNPIPKYFCSERGKIGPKGSVLISVRAPVGKMNVADADYCIGRGLSSIIGKEISSKYLYYYIAQTSSNLQRLAQGSTFEAIGSKELNNHIIYASDDESIRDEIVEILETVDLAIEKTEELIAKYEQVKQGMMHDLFTRGVDENGKLRPSYDDSPEFYQETELGFMPKSWRLLTFEELTTKIIDGTHHTPTYTEEGIPFLRVTDIQDRGFNWDRFKYVSKKEHQILIKRCKPEKGDILYSKNGTIGIPRLVTWDWEFSVFVSLALIKINKNIASPLYIEQLLKSGLIWSQIHKRAKQGTVTNLHLEEIREFQIPLPQKNEQELINQRLKAIDDTLLNETLYLEKLQKQKAGLMQDLLTGQVSVNVEQKEAA